MKWTKYQSKVTAETQDQYLDYLIDPSFQRVNRHFVLSFEDSNSFYKDHYKMVANDISKQQAPDADPRAIQQINFPGNLDQPRNTVTLDV